MVKKLFSLSEADLELLKDVKGQNTFLENDSDTLRYILKHYQELEEENEELRRVTFGSANIERWCWKCWWPEHAIDCK